jgi:hypothetical protein
MILATEITVLEWAIQNHRVVCCHPDKSTRPEAVRDEIEWEIEKWKTFNAQY